MDIVSLYTVLIGKTIIWSTGHINCASLSKDSLFNYSVVVNLYKQLLLKLVVNKVSCEL